MKSQPRSTAVLLYQVSNDDEQRVATLLQEAEPIVINDPSRAERLIEDAYRAAVELGARRLEAHALCLKGALCFFLGQYENAREHFNVGARRARQAGDQRIEARCGNGLGLTAQKFGDYGSAMEYYLESLKLVQETGDEAGRVRVISNIARVHAELGEYQQALELHLEAMQTARREGFVIYGAAAAVNAAIDYYRLGRFEESLTLGEETLRGLREHGLRQYEGELLTYRALTLLETGQPGAALAVSEETLPLIHAIGDREIMSYMLLVNGRAHAQLGNDDAAMDALGRALALTQEIGAIVREAEAHQVMSHVLEARQEFARALAHARKYHELERRIRAEDVDRKTKVLSAQVKLELLKREAEMERLRNVELASANAALTQARQELEHQAMHDALTGLANRVHFEQALEQTLSVESQSGHVHAVLFIDLDRFKLVNDTLGHDAGDELLKQVAQRLRRAVRSHDLIARMGGDEFTLILRDLSEAGDAQIIARKLLDTFQAPFLVAGTPLHVTASIGVAVAPRDGRDVTTLQRHADMAMYRAKHDGKNNVRIFTPAMSAEAVSRAHVERDLREALTHQQFLLHYQGQFDVPSGQLVGFEALLRWQHPTRGLIPPGVFIPVAESSKLILPIGAWVLHEACRQAAAWGARDRQFTVSVNVSAVQFEEPDFVGVVEGALRASGLTAECLVLELTESVVLRDVDLAVRQLEQLRALGVRIAMDDFGTGQSSLSVLRRLPINVLKIDRSFIQDDKVQGVGASRVLVGVMVSLAHGLRLQVTAEGVETGDQFALLGELGCDAVQGFHLARPLPAAEAEALLNSRVTRGPAEA